MKRGLLSWSGLQETIIRTAPLLLIAAGLIFAFRAGIWNLGVDGQFLLAAVVTAALAPELVGTLGRYPTIAVCLVVAALRRRGLVADPGLPKARFGVNEIITTLMMSFLGTSFANVLIKIPFKDPATTVPQTQTLPVADRLPRLGDTTINSGVILAVIAVLLVHLLMTRTAFGLKLQIVGANPRAAVHAGLSVGQAHLRHLRAQRRLRRPRRPRSTYWACGATCAPTGTRNTACSSFPSPSSRASTASPSSASSSSSPRS